MAAKNKRIQRTILAGCLLAAGVAFSFAAQARVEFSELVTVTDNSFSLYWKTSRPETCTIKYGTSRKNLNSKKAESGKAAQFHFLSVAGLQPDAKYLYALECNGLRALPSRLSPGMLVTQTPPAGKLLFSFAVATDIHMGETIAGLIMLPVSWMPALSPGFVWKYPVDDYWAFTLRNAVDQINRQPVDFTVVNGDLSSESLPEEFELAKNFLDKLNKPYYVLRGNHDRVGRASLDRFKKVFNLEESSYSFEHKGFLFVCLDDTRLSDGWGEISEKGFQWLEKTLADHKNEPTFIFSHHPNALGGPDIGKQTTARFKAILDNNPQIIACFYGHKHYAKIVMFKSGGREIPQILVPSTKEYPSGFGIVRVYQSGMVYNFLRTDCADCLEWSAVTRKEYFGLAPITLFGKLADRNLVYSFPGSIQEMERP